MDYINYYGIPLPKLAEGSVPIGAVISMKMMSEHGNITYHEFKSPDIHAIEALGMLDTFSDTIRDHIKNSSHSSE